MFRDMALYLRDWYLSPAFVSQDLIDDEDRNSLALAGILFGIVAILAFQVLYVVLSGIPLNFTQFIVAILYVAFMFALDVIFLEIATSITNTMVSLGENMAIAAFVSTTSIFSLPAVPIVVYVPAINNMYILLFLMLPHVFYLLTSLKGITEKSWLALLGTSILSLVLIFIFFAVGVFAHVLLFNF